MSDADEIMQLVCDRLIAMNEQGLLPDADVLKEDRE